MISPMTGRGKSAANSFSVGAVCRRLGIGPHTLRAWESRYLAVKPGRSETGRRLYSSAELDRLGLLVKLVNLGHAIGTVANLSGQELLQLLRKSRVDEDSSQFEELKPQVLEELHNALERFDVHAVSRLLDQKRMSLGTRAFILQILLPLLRWIGTAIDEGKLSIAHEHALSAVLKDQVFQSLRYGTQTPSLGKGPRFVLATPEDDLHEFGVLMSSALLAHYGLSYHFLGANLPAEALAIAVKAVKGTVVVLGNSPAPEDERQFSFEAYLSELHRLLPKTVEVWVGGAGTVPHLRRVMPGRTCRVLSSMQELDSILQKETH